MSNKKFRIFRLFNVRVIVKVVCLFFLDVECKLKLFLVKGCVKVLLIYFNLIIVN